MAKKALRKKNLFITFEGGEGTGKSTHIKFLEAFLKKKGKSVKTFREPGSSALGEKIRGILLHSKGNILPETELFLYLAARTQFIKEKLQKALDKYDVVICDRFSDSTLVYQGYALKLGMEKIKQLVDFGACGIIPDLTFVLDVEPKKALKRIQGKKDRIERRPMPFHQALRRGYKILALKEPKRVRIIHNEDKDHTHLMITRIVEKYV
jgi:dTMP kinase